MIFFQRLTIFLNNSALKTLRRCYESTGQYETTKNNVMSTVSILVNSSVEKIPEGENIDKQVEIGLHQCI